MEQWNRAHTFDRSCEIIRTYLNLLGNEDLSPKSDEQGRQRGTRTPGAMGSSATHQLSLSNMSMQSESQQPLASFREPSASAPLSRFSRPRLHSPSPGPGPGSGPDFGDTLDGDGGSSSGTAKTRLACPQCQRTFSTVSNRNKHVREGCAHRQKNGYRCRHPNCTKVLTTKWYRNTHEQERCKYRGSTTSHHGSLT
jgi:hypothetical protein